MFDCYGQGRIQREGWVLQPSHQWKYWEGEGEEEVEERRKNGEMVEEEEISPPSILLCIRHCPQGNRDLA